MTIKLSTAPTAKTRNIRPKGGTDESHKSPPSRQRFEGANGHSWALRSEPRKRQDSDAWSSEAAWRCGSLDSNKDKLQRLKGRTIFGRKCIVLCKPHE